MKKTTKIQTAASARQQGQKYFEGGAVTVQSREDKDGMQIVKGKVKCNFGFIHYPKAAVVDKGATVLVSSACDCYESNEDANVCSHVYGLLNAAGYTGSIAVRKIPSIYLKEEEEERGGTDFKLEILTDETDGRGTRKVTGKAVCNFNFIHRPSVILADGVVKEYACDCYMAAGSEDPCPHCQALITKIRGAAARKAAPAAESQAKTEEAPEDFAEGEISFDGGVSFAGGEADTREVPEEAASQEDFAGEPEEALEEAQPEEEPVDEEAGDPTREPGTMTVIFGDNEEGNPVLWQPNDTARLFHTNTGIIGTMGTGKTQFTKSMIAQLYREQPNNYTGQPLGILIFDYKGDYNESKPEFVEAVDARVYKLYKLPFNPFSLSGFAKKPQLPLHAASTFTDIIQKIYKLGPKQCAILTHCIADAYKARGIIPGNPATWNRIPPTFADVYRIYSEDETIAKNDVLFAAMEKLASFEIFEEDPLRTESLYDMLKGVVVIDLSGYDSGIQNLVVAFMLELFYSQMQNAGSSKTNGRFRQLRKYILVDEADNFMSQGFPALKKILKEGREFGVGVILSTQFLTHFNSKDENYSKYILTWVVHNVADLKRKDVEYVFHTETAGEETEKIFQEIKGLESHTSLVKIGNDDVVKMKDLPFFRLNEV